MWKRTKKVHVVSLFVGLFWWQNSAGINCCIIVSLGSSDGRASTGKGKRLKKEIPSFLNADLNALQNQAGALQEKAMDAAITREKYLSEWEWDHGLKLLWTEAEANALFHQRRKDLEEYYQYRLGELESGFKERSQCAEAEFKEWSQRADTEYQHWLDDLQEEKQLFYEQQKWFEELCTGLEHHLASQWKSNLITQSTNSPSNPGTH